MGDNWDDSDDDWDKSDDDDELNRRLAGLATTGAAAPPAFDDDEEDLTLKDKAADERANAKVNKAKGSALAKKKEADAAAKEELELAKKAMAMEAEMEANMTPEERRRLALEREEEDGMQLADALFGGPDKTKGPAGDRGKAMMSGDKVMMKDLKDHLRHAKKVGECIKGHGKVNLCSAFLNELVQQCKEVLDDEAVTEIIKACNIIKNEKVMQAKRKVKGQAQKSKKENKTVKKKAMDINKEVFGDNDEYDEYDDIGGAYEDDFF